MTIKNYKIDFGVKRGMNREQRRAYAKKIKNDPNASICPECGNKARFYTHARGEKDTVLLCEVCGKVIREGEELTKLIPPGIYIPGKLEMLDQMLLEEAARIETEEEQNEQGTKDGAVEVEGSVT